MPSTYEFCFLSVFTLSNVVRSVGSDDFTSDKGLVCVVCLVKLQKYVNIKR